MDWTAPAVTAVVRLEPSDGPHITIRERDEIDRVVRATLQARAAGIDGLRALRVMGA